MKTVCDSVKPGEVQPFFKKMKVFVHGFRDFSEYMAAVQARKVSKKNNRALWNTLLVHWQDVGVNAYDMINHNLDVPIFHVKFEEHA